MAEGIHATPNMMNKAKNTQGDGEEGIEDDYDSIESLGDQHQDYVEIEESSNTLGTVRSQQQDPVSPPSCPIRAVVIHSTPNMMTKARNTQGEREERIVEIYATSESLGDQHQDYVGTEESSNTLGTVRSQQPDPVSPPRWPIRAVVVLLVLLSVVLLARLLGLAVKHKRKTESMDRDVEQLLQRLKNVTEQRDSVLRPQDCACGWTKFGCKCYQRVGILE